MSGRQETIEIEKLTAKSSGDACPFSRSPRSSSLGQVPVQAQETTSKGTTHKPVDTTHAHRVPSGGRDLDVGTLQTIRGGHNA